MPDDPGSESLTLSEQAVALPRLDRYELRAELGRGGMGVVYLARHHALQRDVAVKVLLDPSDSPAVVARFLREGQLPAALEHRHICRVYDVGEFTEAGVTRPYLVLELVTGATLKVYAAGGPTLADRVRVGSEIALALATAHAAGIVHRDIKPSNVMLDAEGHVRVLDFGLARRVTAPVDELTKVGQVVGTLRYMAPEQARGEEATAAVDLFALGVVLYELLTGQHPFHAPTDLGVVVAAQSRDPATPRAVNPEVSEALSALVLALLAKEPTRRPSAAEVARTLARLAVSPCAPVAGATLPPTVGRDRERGLLRQAFDEARSGRGTVVGVTGEPGLGKTTLVEDFLATLASGSEVCWLLRGRCSERLAGAEAYLPVLEALDGLLRGPDRAEVARVLRTVAPTWYAQVAAGSGDDFVQAVAELGQASTERLKRELFNLLAELSRSRPLVLFLDDLHWADISTTDVLSYLAPRCARLRLLVLATYRVADLVRDKHPFRECRREQTGRTLREIALPFLGRDDVTRYLGLRFPGHAFPPGFAEVLYRRTEGNPLFLAGLLDYLQDRTAIVADADTWRLAPGHDLERDLPESVRGLIDRKLDRLDDADRALLTTAAVQGVAFESAVVARATGREAGEVEDRLAALERETDLVRAERETELPDGTLSVRYGFVHVLYQDALQTRLTPNQRVRQSRSVAEALLALVGESAAAELALLFEAARDWPRAVRFFLAAARAAGRIFAFHEAQPLVQRGLAALARLPEGRDRDLLDIQLHEVLATSTAATGGFAAPTLLTVCTHALTLCARAEYEEAVPGLLAGLYLYHLNSGAIGQALNLGDQLLQRAESRSDSASRMEALVAIGVARFNRGEYRVALESLDAGIALDDGHQRFSSVLSSTLNPQVGGRCYAALCLWLLGYPEQARARLPGIDKVPPTTARPWPAVQVFARFTSAIFARLAGDAPATERYAGEVIAVADEYGIGGPWRAFGSLMRGWAWLQLGRPDEGLTEVRAAHDIYFGSGSRSSSVWFLTDLAESLAQAGRPEEGLAALAPLTEIQARGVLHRRDEAERIRGELVLALGRESDAVACFRRAIAYAQASTAKYFELRAMTSLAKLLQRQGRHAEARTELAGVYGWFTEGHDTPELVAARKLLAALEP